MCEGECEGECECVSRKRDCEKATASNMRSLDSAVDFNEPDASRKAAKRRF